jgi:hypothetical protein
MHLYVFLKVRAAFSPGILAIVIICFFMVSMVLAPMLVRMSERAGFDGLAMALAYVGYTWMGALLIFVVVAICTDIFRLLVHISGALLGRNVTAIASAHLVYFFLCLASSLFVVIYGSYEAKNIKAEHIVIETNKISEEVGSVRLAQISDVHLGLIVGEERLSKIIKVIHHASPDVLVSTGDLLDGQPDRVDLLMDHFNDVDVPHKFAVTGNHEAYFDRAYGDGASENLTQKAGFTLLTSAEDTEGAVARLPGLVTIVGVDDEAGRGWRSGGNDREASLCSEIEQSQFTVLLKHRPVPYTGQACTYDLQLSGHTHRGQIFPFYFVTKFFFRYYAGLHKLKNDGYLYVSRGSGTWGPPIRFLAPPEVTIIDLVHKAH